MTLALRLGVLLLAAFATGAQARPRVPEHGIACTASRRCRPFDIRARQSSRYQRRRLTQGVLAPRRLILSLSSPRTLAVRATWSRACSRGMRAFTLYGRSRAPSRPPPSAPISPSRSIPPRNSPRQPVTAEDVLFSWQPAHRASQLPHHYARSQAESLSERAVRFDYGANVRVAADPRPHPGWRTSVHPERFEDTTFEPIVRQRSLVVGPVEPGEASRSAHPGIGRDLSQPRRLELRRGPLLLLPRRHSHLRHSEGSSTTPPKPIRAVGAAYDYGRCGVGSHRQGNSPYCLPKIFPLVFTPPFGVLRIRVR